MKSKLFYSACFLFLLYCLPPATAQLGFKAGPGVSDIGFLKNGQTSFLGYEAGMMVHRIPMPTFQAGAFGTFRLGHRFEFQPELLFITQGLDYSTDFLYDDVTYKVKISYVHAPLLLKYQTSVKRKWRPFLFGGAYVSRKLKAIRLTEIEGQKEKIGMSNVKDMDVGIIGGYAAEFNLPAGEMTIGIRTSYSLANMMDRVKGALLHRKNMI